MRHATVDQLRPLLVTSDRLTEVGLTRAARASALEGGELHRLRRGWYMWAIDGEQLWPESQHRAHVLAAHEDAREAPVFAFTSAAVLWGLPLYRTAVPRVHTAVGDAGRHSAAGVVRHRGAIDDADIVDVAGMRCTSLERTVYDLARLASPEVAVVAADAALGRIAGDPRRYDLDSASRWRESMVRRASVVGVRGIRQARTIIEMADGRSELALESVTKLQLRRLGFRQPRLQVPIERPGGERYWMDMYLEEADAFYECDGESKYLDEAMRGGRSAERVVLDEKRREDWVRGVTGARVVRGGSADAASPASMAARLMSFGIPLPDRRARLILPSRPLLAGQ